MADEAKGNPKKKVGRFKLCDVDSANSTPVFKPIRKSRQFEEVDLIDPEAIGLKKRALKRKDDRVDDDDDDDEDDEEEEEDGEGEEDDDEEDDEEDEVDDESDRYSIESNKGSDNEVDRHLDDPVHSDHHHSSNRDFIIDNARTSSQGSDSDTPRVAPSNESRFTIIPSNAGEHKNANTSDLSNNSAKSETSEKKKRGRFKITPLPEDQNSRPGSAREDTKKNARNNHEGGAKELKLISSAIDALTDDSRTILSQLTHTHYNPDMHKTRSSTPVDDENGRESVDDDDEDDEEEEEEEEEKISDESQNYDKPSRQGSRNSSLESASGSSPTGEISQEFSQSMERTQELSTSEHNTREEISVRGANQNEQNHLTGKQVHVNGDPGHQNGGMYPDQRQVTTRQPNYHQSAVSPANEHGSGVMYNSRVATITPSTSSSQVSTNRRVKYHSGPRVNTTIIHASTNINTVQQHHHGVYNGANGSGGTEVQEMYRGNVGYSGNDPTSNVVNRDTRGGNESTQNPQHGQGAANGTGNSHINARSMSFNENPRTPYQREDERPNYGQNQYQPNHGGSSYAYAQGNGTDVNMHPNGMNEAAANHTGGPGFNGNGAYSNGPRFAGRFPMNSQTTSGSPREMYHGYEPPFEGGHDWNHRGENYSPLGHSNNHHHMSVTHGEMFHGSASDSSFYHLNEMFKMHKEVVLALSDKINTLPQISSMVNDILDRIGPLNSGLRQNGTSRHQE
eukprot:CAMPEP_0115028794 /NCGR_PEP_ID=MMETSP0216-20121206/36561_1 /TAXON_ID=223996 /ORGANISM="Protocruzia adherens, Strain Boccale" /LENGTH=734 /DNA_ID=CAMNT_0002405143 /DNA_START=912 /DNA_END=3116 /DNA_ORIENTATION=-